MSGAEGADSQPGPPRAAVPLPIPHIGQAQPSLGSSGTMPPTVMPGAIPGLKLESSTAQDMSQAGSKPGASAAAAGMQLGLSPAPAPAVKRKPHTSFLGVMEQEGGRFAAVCTLQPPGQVCAVVQPRLPS
jgi:hypothetical protein